MKIEDIPIKPKKTELTMGSCKEESQREGGRRRRGETLLKQSSRFNLIENE